jgi:hypothetical protein
METLVKSIVVSINEMIEYIKNEVETMKTPPFLNITYDKLFDNWVKKCKEDGSINPYWKQNVTKETTKTYLLVVNYVGRTDGNNGKEGIEEKHELGQLKGKKHVSKSVLCNTDETKNYLMVEQFLEIKPSKTIFRHNGNEIDRELFQKWETYYDNYTNQLSERKVMVQTLDFNNIKRIKVNGIEFLIKH